MSSAPNTVFNVGAVLFSLSTVAFFALYLAFRDDLRRHVSISATIVSCVTAAANVAQAEGYFFFTRDDGAEIFWLEWAGYAVSLFFIGSSVFRFLSAGLPSRNAVDALYSGLILSVVGLVGLVGLAVSSTTRFAQIALVLFTTIAYAAWIVDAARHINPNLRRRTAVLVYFVVSTLLYVVGYVAGPPVFGSISVTAEKTVYLVGNLLTKIVLPALELVFMYQQKRKGSRK